MYPQGNLLIPAPHGRLEAIIKEPEQKFRGVALVAHPHPLGGGTMHNKVVFRAAAGLLDAGLVTLRFNFRGVGLSTGTHDDGRGEQDDIRTALVCFGLDASHGYERTHMDSLHALARLLALYMQSTALFARDAQVIGPAGDLPAAE